MPSLLSFLITVRFNNSRTQVNRSIFYFLIGILVLFFCSNKAFSQSSTEKSVDLEKPNVLFIICDDLNDWALHPPAHPKAKVPNIDKLSKKGIVFTNAHAVVPVCGPSRKSLFSGLYPQTPEDYGFASWKNSKNLQECVPLPLHFRNNGYNSYGTGKLLHEGAGGDFYTAYGIGPDYGPWPWQGKGKPEFTAHSNHYKQWKEYLPVYDMHRDLDYAPLSDVPEWHADEALNIPGASGWYNKNGEPFKYIDDSNRDKTPDEISADWAVEILGQKHDRPFYLAVGFIRPHTPLYAPAKYFDMYPLDEIQLPPYKKDDLDDCASALRDRWQWGFKKYEALIESGGEMAWKEWVQAYMACMTFVDNQIGKVLDALEESPYKNNTIVILTSDNGYHVGEKNSVQKWHLWDESTRVPLVIYAPDAQGNGKACKHPVSLIDVYPTLADLCNLPGQPNQGLSDRQLDGHSMMPFLQNPKSKKWKGPEVAFTGIWDNEFSGPKDEDDYKPHFSVISNQYRYTLCSNGEEELYNHKKDPNEWTNLAGDKKYTKIKAKLSKQLITINKK